MVAKLVKGSCLITLFMSFTVVSYAGLERFWVLLGKDDDTIVANECENLTQQQQQQLIQTYQSLRDDEKKLDLKKRMEWFCNLSEDEQFQMREAWQNMSTAERTQLREKLETASSAQERAEIRREFLSKYSFDN